jgi:NifU-like protein involved in Fe-S cluster formation
LLRINSFSSVGDFPMRIKCATLPWIGLNSLLFDNKKKINIDKV